MEEIILHKVKITPEAKFDYASIFGLLEEREEESFLPSNFQIPTMKEELEKFIQINKRFYNKHYFKLLWKEEKINCDLFIFIKRGKKFGIMQNWNVEGICSAKCWKEEQEENGMIRSWLDTKILDLPNEKDWVEESYRAKILLLLDLIYDIGGRIGYIRSCEGLIKKLSSESSEDSVIEPTTRNIRRFIKEKHFDSKTANDIIGILNEMLERERIFAAQDDFYR